MTASLAGDAAFQAVGPTPARDFAYLGAALRLAQPTEGTTLEAANRGRVGSSYFEHVALFCARVDF